MEALHKTGAPHLASQRDRQAKWAQELDREDGVRVRVAKTLLAMLDWLVIDDVPEGLQPAAQVTLCSLFASLPCSII